MFDECLVIVYKSNIFEYAGLHWLHGSDQALEGNLYDKEGREIPDSHVSLTRHDDDEDPITRDAFVSFFFSSRQSKPTQFIWNLTGDDR